MLAPQIHKATLSEWGAAQTGKAPGTVVAVKVRHPGVSTMMQRDFVLMQRAAALSAKLPVLRDLNLEESVRQFGAPLREQLDLSSEVGLGSWVRVGVGLKVTELRLGSVKLWQRRVRGL